MSNRDKAAEIIYRTLNGKYGDFSHHEETAAALADAGLLAPDLPDEWVDAKELREVIDKLREDGHYVSENLADKLEAILPTPPSPRTLADMAPEERAECEWMQCDHPALEEPGVILQIWGNGCHVLSREGVVETEALNHVTPRPDLPRMQWPENGPEDDVAAATGGELTTQDVVDECRAVRKERSSFYAAAPRPEDMPVGEVWLLEVHGRVAIGFRNDPEDRFWAVVYRDIDGTDWLRDDEVTLIARLVPETTEQDDATETDKKAQHDWDTKADMFAQGAAMAYSMAAQWLEEALGDTDD